MAVSPVDDSLKVWQLSDDPERADMKIVAFVPARIGSKGLKEKNLREINGKPLVAWSLEAALAAPSVNRVILSTDNQRIAEIGEAYGVSVPELRPDHLATDEATTESAMLHAMEAWCQDESFDAMVLLQPTSPLRMPGAVEAAINQFDAGGFDSLVSVCESHAFFWQNVNEPKASYDYISRPRRQDISDADRLYRENGSIYITRCALLKKSECRLGGRITLFKMASSESVEIDDETDFKVVEMLMRETGR